MAEPNGYDWRERMRRMEDSIERNWVEHDKIFQSIAGLDKSNNVLRESNLRLHDDVVKLLDGIRKLLDRIPPDNLRKIE
jgi:hypothetical protein